MTNRCPHCHGEIEETPAPGEYVLRSAGERALFGSYERSLGPTGSDYWSPELFSILGLNPEKGPLSPEEFVLHSVHPEDRDRLTEVVGRAIAKPVPYDLEYRIVRPDGEVRLVHSVGEPVRDREGTAVKLVGTLLDITERRRAEEALRDREALLHAILDTDVEGIITIDAAGLIESFNPGAERMFGYAASEVIGREVALLMPAPHQDRHADYITRYLEGSEARIIGIGREVEGERKDGATFPMEISVSDVKVGDRRIFTGILRDITERKRLEEEFLEAQKMEAIGRLAGGIAHDFNNLLMGVRGCCRLATQKLEAESPALSHVEEIRTAVDAGAAMTRQLLAFSRRRRFTPQPMKVNAEITAAVGLLRQFLGEDIHLSAELAPSGGPVLAAPGQIEQILMNLVVNARDAMPEGGDITIETTSPGQGEGHVEIIVRDTGTGMNAETKRRAFEPFFTTKGAGEGSGLGLSTVYGIVKQLGGQIELESELGAGTTFRIHLPRTDAAVPEAPAPAQEVKARGGDETLLVVEDERLVRMSVCEYLGRRGYKVLEAAGPADALRLCDETEDGIDLLLTDIVLPGMGGRELARELEARFPEMRSIYMSAYPEDLLVEQGRIEPGLTTLEKPFRMKALATKVRQILDS